MNRVTTTIAPGRPTAGSIRPATTTIAPGRPTAGSMKTGTTTTAPGHPQGESIRAVRCTTARVRPPVGSIPTATSTTVPARLQGASMVRATTRASAPPPAGSSSITDAGSICASICCVRSAPATRTCICCVRSAPASATIAAIEVAANAALDTAPETMRAALARLGEHRRRCSDRAGPCQYCRMHIRIGFLAILLGMSTTNAAPTTDNDRFVVDAHAVTARLVADSTKVIVGEPVMLEVRIANETADAMYVVTSPDHNGAPDSFTVVVSGPDGAVP